MQRTRDWITALSGASTAAVLIAWLSTGVNAQPAAAQPEVPANYAAHPAPDQPLPYSHKTHLALGLTCDTCHAGTQAGAQLGIPAAATCMSCHSAVAADRPAIQALARFAAAGDAIPWVRVYEVLPGVKWAHQPHLDAGVGCGACHGDVAALDALAMTTSVTAMASCIGCHEAHAAATSCATCHAWPIE
jgi:hypothetical protein